MKKIVMTAALVACAAVVTAQTVTSANIVGYSKNDLGAGKIDIYALQFSGNESGVVLSNAVSGISAGTTLYEYTGSNYVFYVYYGEPGWYSSGGAPSDGAVVAQGSGVWLQDPGAGATTIQSGEVPMVASVTNTLQVGINLVGNPYPVETPLSDLSAYSSAGDVVYQYKEDGTGYNIFYYYGAPGWYSSGGAPSDGYTIDVGQGFWLQSAAGGDIIFNKGY